MTTLILLVPSLWLRDTVGAVGTGYVVRKIVVADGRNEGANRVYVKADTASDTLGSIVIHEFGWSGAWSGGAAFSFVTQGGGGAALAVGNGRNNGVNRLYTANAGCPSSRFYEAVWNGAAWDTVGWYGGPRSEIVIGDGRNDGVNRLYMNMGGTQEQTWAGAGWDIQEIYNVPLGGVTDAIALGQGRNDGINRVYVGIMDENTQYFAQELTYSGGPWQARFVGFGGSKWAEEARVGALKPDDSLRVYVLYRIDAGPIYEHAYLRNAASQYPYPYSRAYVTTVWPDIGFRFAPPFDIGPDPCGSGQTQLFSVSRTGEVWRTYWSGNVWTDERLDSLGGELATVTVGVGRNDGVPRLYVAGAGGYVYELSCTASDDEERGTPAQPLALRAENNALRAENNALRFALPAASAVTLSLYDASGRRCATLFSGTLSAGEHSFSLPELPRGVYVARLTASGRSVGVTLVR